MLFFLVNFWFKSISFLSSIESTYLLILLHFSLVLLLPRCLQNNLKCSWIPNPFENHLILNWTWTAKIVLKISNNELFYYFSSFIKFVLSLVKDFNDFVSTKNKLALLSLICYIFSFVKQFLILIIAILLQLASCLLKYVSSKLSFYIFNQ